MAKRIIAPEDIGRINAILVRQIEAEMLLRVKMLNRVLEAWHKADKATG